MILEPARFIHDTRTIIAINPAVCILFRCEAISLIDRDMMDLIAFEDFRGLARLRMAVLRDQDKWPLPGIKYPFLRGDGTIFWASVETRKIGDGTFETTVIPEI